MRKKTFAIILIFILSACALMLVSGCSSEFRGEKELNDLELNHEVELGNEAEANTPITHRSGSNLPTLPHSGNNLPTLHPSPAIPQSPEMHLGSSYVPLGFRDLDEFLQGVGMAKFMEEPDSLLVQYRGFNTIFASAFVPERMVLTQVRASGHSFAFWFSHVDDMDSLVDFIWSRTTPPEIHMNEIFGRGEANGYWKEHNGIDYAVTEWNCHITGEFAAYIIWWVQYGQPFKANVPACFTLEEALAFAYAIPFTTWQLDGDAVSVSIQGMEAVTIHDADGNEIIAIDDVLYRVVNDDRESIGYRWPIESEPGRYQYVLKPGSYSFFAEDVTGEPGLIVRHFVGGEEVGYEDFAEELDAGLFDFYTLTVTTNPDENHLVINFIPSHIVSFEANPPTGGTITAYVEGRGYIRSGARVAGGSHVTFTATPNEGLRFDGWVMNRSPLNNGPTGLIIESLSLDVQLIANFVVPDCHECYDDGCIECSACDDCEDFPCVCPPPVVINPPGQGPALTQGPPTSESGQQPDETDTGQQQPTLPPSFADVGQGRWYHNYVTTVVEAGLFQGVSSGLFAPDVPMTRAMFVQVLANLEGVNLAAYTGGAARFDDVASGTWYFAAVQWAYANDITLGVSATNFAPHVQVTREQVAVLLHRYVQQRGIQLPQGVAVNFTDRNAISYWASDAVTAMQRAGIVAGHPDGNFAPRGTATRAQAAAIFARLLEIMP